MKTEAHNSTLIPVIKGKDGLSLIEMLIVIAIISLLIGIASLQFSKWNTKYNIEGQTKEMYSDLMEARANAMSRNRDHIFRMIDATRYQTLADLNGDGDYDDTVNNIAETGAIKTLKNAIQWNSAAPANSDVTFNSRGLATTAGTINVATNTAGAVYDCIVISWTRINMGLMSGGSCAQK
jgi:type IV fimbrial biogenesis protein FimT